MFLTLGILTPKFVFLLHGLSLLFSFSRLNALWTHFEILISKFSISDPVLVTYTMLSVPLSPVLIIVHLTLNHFVLVAIGGSCSSFSTVSFTSSNALYEDDYLPDFLYPRTINLCCFSVDLINYFRKTCKKIQHLRF